ncbi:hypothetical protein SBOR_2341 [Sclerotinia borealis F-4128]|uniref:Uncharacterized protein n=1 Tax=Sclerotinia borealis (strain F-4128) TaxID=1432307 RepID=W9CKD9_SCLBF|nr:hypothetical protein SBOR_2341 [Sclerotinia borealis F-4128]
MTTPTFSILPPGELPNPLTSCRATETFHHFCGHVTTVTIHHSPLCTSCQPSPPPSPLQPSSSQFAFRSPPGTPSTARPRRPTLTRPSSSASMACFNTVERSGTLQSPTASPTGPREIPPLSITCSATSAPRISCPQLLIQPLYNPAACASCAKLMGLESEETDEMVEREMEQWEKRKQGIEERMREWAVKLNDWEEGVRVLRRGGN